MSNINSKNTLSQKSDMIDDTQLFNSKNQINNNVSPSVSRLSTNNNTINNQGHKLAYLSEKSFSNTNYSSDESSHDSVKRNKINRFINHNNRKDSKVKNNKLVKMRQNVCLDPKLNLVEEQVNTYEDNEQSEEDKGNSNMKKDDSIKESRFCKPKQKIENNPPNSMNLNLNNNN